MYIELNSKLNTAQSSLPNIVLEAETLCHFKSRLKTLKTKDTSL